MDNISNDDRIKLLDFLRKTNFHPDSGKNTSLLMSLQMKERYENLKLCFYDSDNSVYQIRKIEKFIKEFAVDKLHFYKYCLDIYTGMFINGYYKFIKQDLIKGNKQILSHDFSKGSKTFLKFLIQYGETLTEKIIILIRSKEEIEDCIKLGIKQILHHPSISTEDYMKKLHWELHSFKIPYSKFRSKFRNLIPTVYDDFDNKLDVNIKKKFTERFKFLIKKQSEN